MPVLLAERVAMLSGTVTVEEVEPLAEWVRAHPTASVVLHNCEHLHTAVLQLFLVHGTKISRPPRDPFLATWVMPLLAQAEESPDPGDGSEAGPAVEARAEMELEVEVEIEVEAVGAADLAVEAEVTAGVVPGPEHADSPDKKDGVEPAASPEVTVTGDDAGAEPISKEVNP